METVRDFYVTVIGNLERHRQDPSSWAGDLERGDPDAGSRRVLDKLDSDIRWKTLVGEVHAGKLGFARGADDLLRAAREYRVSLGEIAEVSDDQVLVAVQTEMTGRGSGVAGSVSFFALFRLRDGLITEFYEYTTRDDALQAVGPDEDQRRDAGR